MKFLCPLLVLTDKYLWRLLVGSKCCIQGIDMFFGQLYVVLNVIQLKITDVNVNTKVIFIPPLSLCCNTRPYLRCEGRSQSRSWGIGSGLCPLSPSCLVSSPPLSLSLSRSHCRFLDPQMMTSHFTISLFSTNIITVLILSPNPFELRI